MKLLSSLLVMIALAGLPAPAPSQSGSTSPAPPPQAAAAPATPAVVRWTQGDKDSELVTQQGVQIEVLHTPGADVAVSLLDYQEFATRAWVQVLNRGQGNIDLEPGKATLEIVKPKEKLLAAISAQKVADTIAQTADVAASDRSAAGCALRKNAGCSQNSSGVASSKEVQQQADAMVANVKSTELKAQALKPGDQAQGAIFFPFERKRGDSVFALPLGGQVFQFPFSAERKK